MKPASKKSRRKAGSLAGSLMLAPSVAAMRMPMLMLEAGDMNPWRVETARAVSEKVAAAMEGAVAAQLSLAWSASRFWPELLSGRTPAILSGAAMEDALHAALKPSGRRVKTNYNRLSRRP